MCPQLCANEGRLTWLLGQGCSAQINKVKLSPNSRPHSVQVTLQMVLRVKISLGRCCFLGMGATKVAPAGF